MTGFSTKEMLQHIIEKQDAHDNKWDRIHEESNDIKNLVNSHFIPDDDIIAKIKQIPFGEELLDACKADSPITNLHLTAVGQAIALTHLETIAGINLNPDVWIN